MNICIDSCYRAVCDTPQSHQDVITSTKPKHWKNAMREEMGSLENCELYIEQPEGFEKRSTTGEKLVCKLKKSLYGLKKSGRNWNTLLHACLSDNGFKQNPANHRVYTKENQNEKVIILIWVDDIIIAASNEATLKNVKKMLTERFKMKDLGKLKHFLAIDFDQKEGQVKMSQTRYVNKILERFGMQECRVRETPCEPKLEYSEDSEQLKDPKEYREAVGSLLYSSTWFDFLEDT